MWMPLGKMLNQTQMETIQNKYLLKQTFRKINNATYGLLKHKYGKPFTPIYNNNEKNFIYLGSYMHSYEKGIIDPLIDSKSFSLFQIILFER